MAATPSEINALIAQARCIDCYPAPIQSEIQTYIMAVVAGTTLDPLALAKLAKCMTCLSTDTLLRIKAYLLARISGPNVRPETLIDDSQCYECVPEGFLQNIETYKLLNDPQSPSTNAAVISRLARCYGCLSPQTLLEVQVYLLALIARLDPDPNTLAEESNVIAEIPVTIIRRVITREIVDLEDGGGGLAGCVDVPADLIPVMTVNYVGGAASTIDVLFPKVCCQPNSFTIYESNNADMSASVDLDVIPMTGAPGEENFTVAGVDVSGATRTYLAVKQNCLDGTVSDYSNIEIRYSGVATANDWADRVEINGGVRPSQASIDAASDFVLALMIGGIWGKMKVINMIAPDNLIASLTPLLVGAGTDPWVGGAGPNPNLSVNGWDYPPNNDCVRTGFVPFGNVAIGNAGATLYFHTNDSVGVQPDCGAISGAQQWTLYGNQGGNFFSFCFGFDASGLNPVALPANPWPGYFSQNRVSTTDHRLFIARSDFPHAQQGATVAVLNVQNPPNQAMGVLGHNSGGVYTGPGAGAQKRVSYVAFHDGLVQAESLVQFNAVQALRTAFGGGFV